ncbi:MAG: hypothetical protein EB084_13750 [Proteobacteria bacterium]|nr:hypothetical protein [Pseudomonadota bacterium]
MHALQESHRLSARRTLTPAAALSQGTVSSVAAIDHVFHRSRPPSLIPSSRSDSGEEVLLPRLASHTGGWPAGAPSPVERRAHGRLVEADAIAPLPAARVTVSAAPVPIDDEARARDDEERLSDALRAREIRARMAADRALTAARIAAIKAEVQTEMFRIFEEVLIRRQKVMADLRDKWNRVMFA